MAKSKVRNKKHPRLAVLDLGSNTFHLIIVALQPGNKFKTILKERKFTYLSDGGIDSIKENRIIDALEAIRYFKNIISKQEVNQIKVIGTASLRTARNRQDFLEPAEEILETKIDIIDGNQEAEYICKGVLISKELHHEKMLIMDIGGGSTEFLIVDRGVKKWAESFPTGLGFLFKQFHKSDPITPEECQDVINYIHAHMPTLHDAIQDHKPNKLVGASGPFELFAVLSKSKSKTLPFISITKFRAQYDYMIHSTLSDRKNNMLIPKERAELAVVSFIFMKAILLWCQPSHIIVSPYALKEGCIMSLLESKK